MVIISRRLYRQSDAGLPTGDLHPISSCPCRAYQTISVRQTDVAGNSAVTTITFTLDSRIDAPAISLLNGIDGITRDGELVIDGLENGAIVEYSLNGEQWSSLKPAFVEGENTVHVRQIDPAGNTSTSSSLTFTLDTTPPNTLAVSLQEDSGLAGDGITNNGQLTVSDTETGATIEYSVDGQTWNNSFTPVSGTNTVYVRQIDSVGNISQPRDPLTFTLDNTTTAPEVALKNDTGSDDSDRLTNSSGLELTGIEDGATVQYSLNNNDWSTEQPGFVQGNNTLYVRQLDNAGNMSPSTTFSFTLDTDVAVPVVSVEGNTLSVTGIEEGAVTEYRTNGGDWSTTNELIEGDNTVQVRQIDKAGNVSDSVEVTFTVDTIAARLTVALADDTGVADDQITRSGELLLGNVEDGATIQYSLGNDQNWSTVAPQWPEGSNTVFVRQIDAAGNISSAETLTFTLDTRVNSPTLSFDN